MNICPTCGFVKNGVLCREAYHATPSYEFWCWLSRAAESMSYDTHDAEAKAWWNISVHADAMAAR